MNGIVVKQVAGDVPQLVWEAVPDVTYGTDEVLVAVRATAVNRADLLQAQGGYNPPAGASPILGLEMAGVITAVGDQVTQWQVGDRVCALLPGGGYAEYAAVPADMLLPIPEGWSFIQAAAVPEVWLTAYVNLFGEANLQTGETVLIHAGASGVGTAAIQLARAAEATPLVTVGSAEKAAACKALGAAVAINYKEQDFLAVVQAYTGGRGVDVVLDCIGGSYLTRNMQALAPLGRLIFIGLMGGGQSEINLGMVMGKRLRLIGSTLRSRPLAEKIALTKGFYGRFWPLLLDGTLRPIIDTTFPIPEAQAAHAYVRANQNTGKVVLEV